MTCESQAKIALACFIFSKFVRGSAPGPLGVGVFPSPVLGPPKIILDCSQVPRNNPHMIILVTPMTTYMKLISLRISINHFVSLDEIHNPAALFVIWFKPFSGWILL